MGVTTVEEKDGLMKAVMVAKAMQANEKADGQMLSLLKCLSLKM